ncbi:hypothetical protein [Microbacterium sp. Root61]|uniref:hypothetical protein n=1 Tax=Microbacterium sp. Root61 TaxID=1736570 RepID=UPI0012E36BBD|nr:hypothetical protein [Microbacterium sp. Root61]
MVQSLQRESDRLMDRAFTVFLEYDFLDYSILNGTLTGGHIITYLAREADRMADSLLAATGRVVPPSDPGRQWENDEGGNLRPGAVILDDLHVSTERLNAAISGVGDWNALSDEMAGIPGRRLLQVVVHHADLGRSLADLPDDDAEIAVALLPDVLGSELEEIRLVIDPTRAHVRAAGDHGLTVVTGPAQELLAWATGRVAGVEGIPPDLARPPLREWI